MHFFFVIYLTKMDGYGGIDNEESINWALGVLLVILIGIGGYIFKNN